MAHSHTRLTVACMALLVLPGILSAQTEINQSAPAAAGNRDNGVARQPANLAASQSVAKAGDGKQPESRPTIGTIPPIYPNLPASQVVMSVKCAVPGSSLAERVHLPRLAGRLRKNKKPVVLAVGSSSTWGAGASDRGHTYPAQLETILEKAWADKDVDVINRGVSGEVAATTADRLLNLAAEIRPDLVLWQLGTNDAVLRVRIEDFEKTVRTTIDKLRQGGIDVVLVGLQYTPKWARDKHYFDIRSTLYKVAKEEKVLYVRRYAAMEFIANTHKNLQIMARDKFHLNDLGYQCMAEHVAQAVIANLFVRRPAKVNANPK